MSATKRTPAEAGALAAGLLVDASQPRPDDTLRMKVVRDLALDLERRLEALANPSGEDIDSLLEAALACADLATLAACNLPVVSNRSLATASVHLSAGAARALISLAESRAGSLDEPHAENTLRDARSARWRADLAVRQIEDPKD
ncbi:MAG TPA: hypothetical protein VJ827_12895 [Rubrobacter sp.]|nr:hypothetical protein [Rubrobacter sp.]